ncbi:ECF-type sigma factor [Anatilimnocola sp. NA78]|uniref:ECF-type sigma factor n=1 Tax=Anatilimnocola sp. NA78 TaxID=3415683 RepID=UPI003CE5B893
MTMRGVVTIACRIRHLHRGVRLDRMWPCPMSRACSRRLNKATRKRWPSCCRWELCRLATRELRGEAAGNSFQPTVLVHEAYLRLIDKNAEPHRAIAGISTRLPQKPCDEF